MLDDVMRADNQDIVSWQSHGKAFRVHKPSEFAKHIMPRHFKQTRYKSFQRQLHIYGFHRITGKGMQDDGAYYHDMFILGEKQLALRMVRQKIKGPDAYDTYMHADPDFYAQQQQAWQTVTTAEWFNTRFTTSHDKNSSAIKDLPRPMLVKTSTVGFFAGKRFFCVEPSEETSTSIPFRSSWTARVA